MLELLQPQHNTNLMHMVLPPQSVNTSTTLLAAG
jgi:hypothetical protein